MPWATRSATRCGADQGITHVEPSRYRQQRPDRFPAGAVDRRPQRRQHQHAGLFAPARGVRSPRRHLFRLRLPGQRRADRRRAPDGRFAGDLAPARQRRRAGTAAAAVHAVFAPGPAVLREGHRHQRAVVQLLRFGQRAVVQCGGLGRSRKRARAGERAGHPFPPDRPASGRPGYRGERGPDGGDRRGEPAGQGDRPAQRTDRWQQQPIRRPAGPARPTDQRTGRLHRRQCGHPGRRPGQRVQCRRPASGGRCHRQHAGDRARPVPSGTAAGGAGNQRPTRDARQARAGRPDRRSGGVPHHGAGPGDGRTRPHRHVAGADLQRRPPRRHGPVRPDGCGLLHPARAPPFLQCQQHRQRQPDDVRGQRRRPERAERAAALRRRGLGSHPPRHRRQHPDDGHRHRRRSAGGERHRGGARLRHAGGQ